MRLCAISDSHNRHGELSLPAADILVHAGDATLRGDTAEMAAFGHWLQSVSGNFRAVIGIPGNHDKISESNWALARALVVGEKTNIHYIHDEALEIDGIKFWASAWTPFFHDWAFNLRRGPRIKAKWDLIPNDTQVLITHGPPKFIGDSVYQGESLNDGPVYENVGCADLSARIAQLRNLTLNVSGHVHSGAGDRTISGIRYVNAAVLNEKYVVCRPPVLIDL